MAGRNYGTASRERLRRIYLKRCRVMAADNAVDHYDIIRLIIEKTEHDSSFDCLTVPI
jgi:hypothetical protein